MKIDELMDSLKSLQKVEDEAKEKRVKEVLDALDPDHDGAIDLNMAIEVSAQLSSIS